MMVPATDTPSGRGTSGSWLRRHRAVLVAGVLGGLVGGALVAVVQWGDADPDDAACAVDEIARQAQPSVVTIEVRTPQGGGNGSGVVYDLPGDGDDSPVIVTNEHVVAPPSPAATGATPPPAAIDVVYADGHRSPARVLGADALTDLAVLEAEQPSDAAPAIEVGDSGDLEVGHPVVVLGSPLGLTATVTSGIVSATFLD